MSHGFGHVWVYVVVVVPRVGQVVLLSSQNP
jgi:hypothetical protein